jgi:exopolysaccharide biosynthesis polyprenyl glycosylphosphotransferase
VLEIPQMSHAEATLALPFSRKLSRTLSELLLSKDFGFYLCTDFLVSFWAFYSIAQWNPRVWMQTAHEIQVAAFLYSISFCVIAVGAGLFEREHRFHPKAFIRAACVSGFLALLMTQFVIYLAFFSTVGRYMLVFGSLGAVASVLFYHWVLSLLLNKYPYRFVVIGEKSAISEGLKNLGRGGQKQWLNYLHVGELETWFRSQSSFTTQALAEALHASRVTDVVMTEEAGKDPKATEFAIAAMQVGCRVIDEVAFYSEVHEAFPSQILSQNWFVFAGIDTRNQWGSFLKRVFDFTFGIFCLVLFSPLLVAIALAVKFTSPGPVLFFQQRQGRYRKPFQIVKFRTMRVDVEGSNPPSTRAKDPRVTFLGKLLRPLHFDELPQIWNIIKGEMSFVGPRPEVYSFTQEIVQKVPIYEFRCLVRPGLTGLSQIKVGYTLDNVEDTFSKLAYDLYYVKNYSLVMDLLIMLRTAFVLTRKVH